MNNPTLRDILYWLAQYGDDAALRIGKTGARYGQPGTDTTPDALLASLEPAELARPVILVWNWREPGYTYSPSDPLGWVHLYETPEYLEECGPALLVMQNGAGPHD